MFLEDSMLGLGLLSRSLACPWGLLQPPDNVPVPRWPDTISFSSLSEPEGLQPTGGRSHTDPLRWIE